MKIPKELQIQKIDFPDVKGLAEQLANVETEFIKSSPVPGRVKQYEIPESYVKAFTSIATQSWRIRTRVLDSLTGEPKEELSRDEIKKVARYVESIYDCFKQIEIEIKDRTGEHFDYGLPEKVVTAIPQESLQKETVLETIRPTIYWNNQIAQQGEVIIATPLVKNN